MTPLHFGVYNYHGLDTLGSGDGGLGDYGLRGVEAAVQMASRNPDLRVYVHPAGELPADCDRLIANQACFFVVPNGSVKPF